MKPTFVIIALLFFAPIVNAQAVQEEIPAFRAFKEVNAQLPTSDVVEVRFNRSDIVRPIFGVYDVQEDVFVSHHASVSVPATPVTITSTPSAVGVSRMTDNNIYTSASFDVPEIGEGTVRLRISAARPITTSSLSMTRDNYVAFPKRITVRANVNGAETIVLNNYEMKSEHIRFPKTTAQEWIVDMIYVQPLRISELTFNEEFAEQNNTYSVRFVAQSGHLYRVYADPDRQVKLKAGEVGNIGEAQNVRVFDAALQPNAAYIPADVDEDGVPDAADNCVQYKNADQIDANANGRGDACDDTDRDGVINAEDNCPDHANRTQSDEDGDGKGDACDGVESRLTEQYPWLPWLGLGFAAAVLGIMFMQAVHVARKK